MNQIAINLIAITVFTLTFSSLLGPVFNLPPAIPALATFFIVGIATLDSFSWKGQGGTLLIDFLAGKSSQHRQRIIHHEAGHFLVAHLFGIPIENYALNAWEAFKQGQSAQGGVRFNDTQLTEQIQQGKISAQIIDRYCILWMAGVAAEILIYGKAEGGAEDRLKVKQILSQIGLVSESNVKERWAYLQALNLIKTNQQAYKSLVEAMQENKPVEECCRLIEEQKEMHPNQT